MAKSSINNWRAGGGAFELTATHSGDGTVSCVAEDGKIICDFTALGSEETITINTPFAFEVIDAHVVVANAGNVAASTLQVKNNTTALSSTMSMATDTGVARATTLDDGQAKFALDDNDLVLVSSAHADKSGVCYIAFR